MKVRTISTAGFAVCLSGLILWLSFPPVEASLVAWIALVPLFVALQSMKPLQSFGLAGLGGVIFFSGIFSWIWTVPAFNFLDYILLALYFSLSFGLFGLALTWLRRSRSMSLALIAPPLWVALEYARAHASFLSAPWMLLGHSQYRHPAIIQICAFTGVYGVSFLIVLVNATIADTVLAVMAATFRKPARYPFADFKWTPVWGCAALLAAVCLYGTWSIPSDMAGKPLRIALIQGNVDQHWKWDKSLRQFTLDRYASLTRQAAAAKPDLIVWPETAVPGDVRDRELQPQVADMARDANAYLLVGSATHAKFSEKQLPGRYFNNMVLFNPAGRIEGEYRKMRLVPFAEYAPFRELIQWPRMITVPKVDLIPGERPTVFTIRGVAVAPTICWENIFADHVREFVRQGANLLVNSTNEAWFGETSAPYQFLAMSVFRAVENRVPIARATNTGVSATIDPFGRIVRRLQVNGRELFVEGVLIDEMIVSDAGTFYTRFGDVFALLQIGFCAWLLVRALATTVALRAPAFTWIKGRGNEG